jgi:Flagellar motor component
MGLIHVMGNLADPSQLGSGIAVAFVATIYGVAYSQLNPAAGGQQAQSDCPSSGALPRNAARRSAVHLPRVRTRRSIELKLQGFME